MGTELSKYRDEIALVEALIPFLSEEKKPLAERILKMLRMMELMEQDA